MARACAYVCLRECCIYRECYRRAAAATGRKASAAACCAYLPSGTPAGTEVPLSGHSLRFFATVRTPLLTCNKRKKRNTLDIATNYMYMYVSIGRLFCEISVFSSYVQWEGKVSNKQDQLLISSNQRMCKCCYMLSLVTGTIFINKLTS